MKIIIIGATGTIGKEVVKALSSNHEVIPVGYKGGDYQVDISSKESIDSLFKKTGKVDAVISTAGLANFSPFENLTDEDYEIGLQNKLMGQVNLVRIGKDNINENGSVTLTSGMLAQSPMPGSASISMVNAGIEGFTRAAALELQNGIRINSVSPIFVKETMEMMGMDPTGGISAIDTAKAYVVSVEGQLNGEVLNVTDYV